MSLKNTFEKLELNNEKALAVFLTAGYPTDADFPKLVTGIFSAGADIIEIGIPFSDPLADGPVIQKSSKLSLDNNITMDKIFEYVYDIRKVTDKPLVLMGYANPVMSYGTDKFLAKCAEYKVDGVIIPDVPVEEYSSFFTTNSDIDKIMLTTPTSSDKRIQDIDKLSKGFVYCVSVTGTTGVRNEFTEEIEKNLERTYSLIKENKMMIGFGISKPEDINRFKDYSDGFIVGSAIVKSLENDVNNNDYSKTFELVKSLKEACK